MGAVMEKLFIDPSTFETWPIPKILFLLAVYGFILFKASNLISDGSELLLLVPSLAGIVGSVILPILGAVPDGMIVLFSGLGPREEAQTQLSVGVGALAGSTIMLLTIPWILTLVAGRVSLDANGKGAYNRKQKLAGNSFHPWRTGTNVGPSVRVSAVIMIATSLSYLLIQGPAFFLHCDKSDESCNSQGEKKWAIAGFVMCIVFFVAYLIYQVVTANKESNKERVDQVRQDAIRHSVISVSAAFADVLFGGEAVGEGSALLQEGHEAAVRFENTLRAFFNKHDADGNGVIDASEMRTLLAELGEHPTQAEFTRIMTEVDTNKDGVIQFSEFKDAMRDYVKYQRLRDIQPDAAASSAFASGAAERKELAVVVNGEPEKQPQEAGASASAAAAGEKADEAAEEEVEDEEEEVPEDLKHLTPRQQRVRILWRACWMMFLGVALVVIFSDPMVDVLDSLGTCIKVPSFYIAFILAPLASNASEIIAAFNYARKKTVRAATISCEALLGAAIMNNSFCLSIFLCLVWGRTLSWEFSAETISILVVEVSMLSVAMMRVQRLGYGFICLALYPGSLLLVLLLEHLGYN